MNHLTVTLPETTWQAIINMLGEANVVPRIAFPVIHALESALQQAKNDTARPPMQEFPDAGT